VQFPDKLRFARLVLPGEETIALYAVQRFDRERSVAVMRDLRRLVRSGINDAVLRLISSSKRPNLRTRGGVQADALRRRHADEPAPA
jgi:hypothetical protein